MRRLVPVILVGTLAAGCGFPPPGATPSRPAPTATTLPGVCVVLGPDGRIATTYPCDPYDGFGSR